MTKRRSYQLLDEGRVIREIAATASSEGNAFHLSGREAREIKPVLPEVTRQIRERVAGLGPEPEPAQVKEVVREVVEETRTTMRQQQAPRRPGRAVGNISRAVSTALADIDRARRELVRLARSALVRRRAGRCKPCTHGPH